MQVRFFPTLLILASCIVLTASASADTFGTGENAFEIEFVTIGDPGNPADTTGDPNPAGAVPYTYRIGKYEIPEHAIRRANAATAESAHPLSITLDERGPDKPATRVSWFEAARFVNYLNEEKVRCPPTSSTRRASSNCGSQGTPATTRTTCSATASPATSCRASTSGTRRRSTIRPATHGSTTPTAWIPHRCRWRVGRRRTRRSTGLAGRRISH